MYVIESKKVREALEFRKKSLRAIGMHAAADLLDIDLKYLMSDEVFVEVTQKEYRGKHAYTEMLRELKA
jgi:uncharacterized protein YxjI